MKPVLLVVRPDRLGDVVVSSTVLSSLIARYGQDFDIVWSVKKEYACLFEGAENFSVVPCEELSNFAKKMQKSAVVFLNPDSGLEKIFENVTNCKIFGWGKTLRDDRKECKILEAEYVAKLLAAADFPIEVADSPQIFLQNSDLKAPLSESYIILHVGSFGQKPTLPPEIFFELTEILQKKYRIVWIGMNPLRKDYKKLSDFAQKMQIVLPPENINVLQLASWIKNAKAVIGRDSGVSHLAAAFAVPIVAIIGPLGKKLAANRWRPMGKKVFSMQLDVKPHFWETDAQYQRRYFGTVNANEVVISLNLLQNDKIP